MENEEQPVLPDADLLDAATRLLSASVGGPVRLEYRDTLRERGRNRVFRLAVIEGPPGAPATVIVKRSVGEDDDVYDPGKDSPHNTTWRFYNEWVSNAFLDTLDADPPFSAHLYGGDGAVGVIVLEDLGPPLSLADRMQGDDRPALEAALLAYARSMGRLHAATIGREEEFWNLRRSIGGADYVREREGSVWAREEVARFETLCANLGVALAPGFSNDVEAVRAELDEPGPFLAFAPCDTCPDNHRLSDDGAFVRFFDYEFSGFRHALLDASYFYTPFPTCWCVNRLPAEAVANMEAAYRAELIPACPEAADDTRFARAMLHACAYWLIGTLSRTWQDPLKEDWNWGIATVRQRHLLRLENFIALSERHGDALPAIAETARAVRAALAARWLPELEEMPLYPPFRSKIG